MFLKLIGNHLSKKNRIFNDHDAVIVFVCNQLQETKPTNYYTTIISTGWEHSQVVGGCKLQSWCWDSLEVPWSGPLPQQHAAGGFGSSRSSHQVDGDDSWLQMIFGRDWWGGMLKPAQAHLKRWWTAETCQNVPEKTEHCSLVKMFIDPDELETECLKQEGLSGE